MHRADARVETVGEQDPGPVSSLLSLSHPCRCTLPHDPSDNLPSLKKAKKGGPRINTTTGCKHTGLASNTYIPMQNRLQAGDERKIDRSSMEGQATMNHIDTQSHAPESVKEGVYVTPPKLPKLLLWTSAHRRHWLCALGDDTQGTHWGLCGFPRPHPEHQAALPLTLRCGGGGAHITLSEQAWPRLLRGSGKIGKNPEGGGEAIPPLLP